MAKEPMDYGMEIMAWVWLLPMRLTENSVRKSVRVFGILSTFIYAPIAMLITGIPITLMLIVMIIIQMCCDA